MGKFADGLGPQCGPANIDLCDADKKAQIAKFQAMSAGDRDKQIAESEAKMAKLESDFKSFVDGLQKQYKEASDNKEKETEEIKNSGLGLLKAVKLTRRPRRQSSRSAQGVRCCSSASCGRKAEL